MSGRGRGSWATAADQPPPTEKSRRSPQSSEADRASRPPMAATIVVAEAAAATAGQHLRHPAAPWPPCHRPSCLLKAAKTYTLDTRSMAAAAGTRTLSFSFCILRYSFHRPSTVHATLRQYYRFNKMDLDPAVEQRDLPPRPQVRFPGASKAARLKDSTRPPNNAAPNKKKGNQATQKRNKRTEADLRFKRSVCATSFELLSQHSGSERHQGHALRG